MNKQELPVLLAQGALAYLTGFRKRYNGYVVELAEDRWYWYHNISECYYHIQMTVKYRKALLEEKVTDGIQQKWKGEEYQIVRVIFITNCVTMLLIRDGSTHCCW